MIATLVIATIILALTLGRLVTIDMQVRRLPDIYTLPLLLGGLALNAFLEQDLPDSAIAGAIAGFVVFWLIGIAYFHLRGVDGLGLGDAKLLAAGGAWLGVAWLPLLVLLSAGGALAFALWRGQNARQTLAFGPWLAGAFFLLWIMRLPDLFV